MKRLLFVCAWMAACAGSAFAAPGATEGDLAEEMLAGAALLADGDGQAAGYHFTQALKIRETPAVHTLILLALLQNRDAAAADRLCSQKTGIALRDPHFHYWCARFRFESGNRAAAATAIENAVSVGGGLAHVLMGAAIMHAVRGDMAKASQYFSTLVRKDPWILHARLYPSPAVGAVLAMEDALVSGDFGARLPHALCALAMRAQDPGLAHAYMLQAWKAYNPPPESMHQLRHQVLRAAGRTQEAEQAIDDALRSYPGSVYFRTQSALRAFDQGNAQRARTLLEAVLADTPKDATVLSLLAYAQLETAQTTLARKSLEYAQAQDADVPMFYFARGMLQQKSGAPAAALADFARAVRLEPTSRRFGAAYLAALEASRDAAGIQKERARQKALEAFLGEIQKGEQKIRERLAVLEQARSAMSGTAKFPSPCDIQCQVFHGARLLREGKNWNPSSVLSRLAARPPWGRPLPPHAQKWEANVGIGGERITVVKYFWSVLPMALD